LPGQPPAGRGSPTLPGLAIHAHYQRASGAPTLGDFYDILPVDAATFVVLGDHGKGIGAALTSAGARLGAHGGAFDPSPRAYCAPSTRCCA